jgi:hypothetical protein
MRPRVTTSHNGTLETLCDHSVTRQRLRAILVMEHAWRGIGADNAKIIPYCKR